MNSNTLISSKKGIDELQNKNHFLVSLVFSCESFHNYLGPSSFS